MRKYQAYTGANLLTAPLPWVALIFQAVEIADLARGSARRAGDAAPMRPGYGIPPSPPQAGRYIGCAVSRRRSAAPGSSTASRSASAALAVRGPWRWRPPPRQRQSSTRSSAVSAWPRRICSRATSRPAECDQAERRKASPCQAHCVVRVPSIGADTTSASPASRFPVFSLGGTRKTADRAASAQARNGFRSQTKAAR